MSINYAKLFEIARVKGISEIEVYSKVDHASSISLFKGQVDTNSIKSSQVFTVRAIYNGQMSYFTFENIDEDLNELVDKLIDNATVLNSKDVPVIFEGSEDYNTIEDNCEDFSKISQHDKIELLKNIESSLKAYSEYIYLVPSVNYAEVQETINIVNSKGLDLSSSYGFSYVTCQVVSKKDDETQTNFAVKAVKKFSEYNIEELVEKCCKGAIEALGGEPCDSGSYDVIIDTDCMSDLLGVFSSMFSGERCLKHLTVLENKINEKIMSDKIKIVEKPQMTESIENRTFDDEGVATTDKVFVSDGVFKGFAHNLKTAKAFNTQSTGNGYKSRDGLGVGFINFMIENGNNSLDDLIKSTKNGLYITSLQGLHAGANDVSGDFSCQCSGFKVVDGVKAEPVTLIVISGNFLKLMSNVEMIANDIEFGPSGVYAPSIKFNNVAISGK